MDNSRPFKDTETKECLHWKEEEPDDIDMLISNGENKGNMFMCETGPLRQGKKKRREISQLTREQALQWGKRKGRQKLANTGEE